MHRLLTRLITVAALFAALGGLVAWSSGSPARGAATRTASTGVVLIETDLAYQGNQAAGTGMVLTSSGEVLTNNHVINGATTIRVIVADTGKTYRAKVVGYSVSDDVAVLQLEGASGLATIDTDTSTPSVGDRVTALGNAGGTGSLTPAAGSVTGVGRSITASDDNGGAERLTGLIETDANVQPGDSGGPLLNAADRVIGMNTAASTGGGFAGYGDNGDGGGNDGFAIPIAHALSIAKQIESGQGSSTVHVGGTAWLGVQVSTAAAGGGNGGGYGSDPNGGGYGYDPNGGGYGYDPNGYGYDPYGNGDQGTQGTTTTGGAVIAGVILGGPADDAGLAEGDTITAVDGHTISSPDDLTQLLGGERPGARVQVAIVDQNGSASTVTVTLGSGPAK